MVIVAAVMSAHVAHRLHEKRSTVVWSMSLGQLPTPQGSDSVFDLLLFIFVTWYFLFAVSTVSCPFERQRYWCIVCSVTSRVFVSV